MTTYNNINTNFRKQMTHQLFPVYRTRFLHKVILHNPVLHRLPITETATILRVSVIFACNNSGGLRRTPLSPTHNPQEQKCQQGYNSNADQCTCDFGAHCPNFG